MTSTFTPVRDDAAVPVYPGPTADEPQRSTTAPRAAAGTNWRAVGAALVFGATTVTAVGLAVNQDLPPTSPGHTSTPAAVRPVAGLPATGVRPLGPLPTVPPPAPSPTYVLPSLVGPSPMPGETGTYGVVASTDRAVICDPTWVTAHRGQVSPERKRYLLRFYKLTPAQVVEWVWLIPADLGGDESAPANAYPMTSVSDIAGRRQLLDWLRTAMCSGGRTAAGPATPAAVQFQIQEYWHWWGAGGYIDPAAQAHWEGNDAPPAASGGVLR